VERVPEGVRELPDPSGLRLTKSIGRFLEKGSVTYINGCLWTRRPTGEGAPEKGQKKGAGYLPHKAHS
jgi:hypothetical protein